MNFFERNDQANEFKNKILLTLPDIKPSKLRCEPDCYGISRLISRKLHLQFTPLSFVNWLHAWFSLDLEYVEQFGMDSTKKYLVATEKHENFLKSRGKNAKAIGAPYVYVKILDDLKITRNPGSLLVMPPHGLSYTTEKFDEAKYVQVINELKKDFKDVVVCIHPSCIDKNHWVKSFNKIGIPFIVGANLADKNSLIRMHRIFQHFEFVTTNKIGSHVAYAAYSGCKVSIYGDYEEFKDDDLKNDLLYKAYPHVLKHNLHSGSEKKIREKYHFLFTHPKDAIDLIDWAAIELGEKYRLPLYKLPYHLGWLPHQQLYHWLIKIIFKLNSVINFKRFLDESN
jgi:hypothetical protein